jgi:hypothetical protein
MLGKSEREGNRNFLISKYQDGIVLRL